MTTSSTGTAPVATATFTDPALSLSVPRAAAPGLARVVEVVRYTLTAGVSREQHLEAGRAIVPFLCAQPGFVRRVHSEGEDGLWIDFVEWESLEQARQAAERGMQEPSLAAFFQSIDLEKMDFRHFIIQNRIE